MEAPFDEFDGVLRTVSGYWRERTESDVSAGLERPHGPMPRPCK